MPDVRLPSFRSSKPKDAHLVRTFLAAATSSALRLSAFADPSSRAITDRRRRHIWPAVLANTRLGIHTLRLQNVLSRPAHDLPASWAPALPVAGTSLLPSPGAAARAGLIPVLLRVPRSLFTLVHSGGSAPKCQTCRQQRRAGASDSSYTFGCLTSACSGLAALAADARR